MVARNNKYFLYFLFVVNYCNRAKMQYYSNAARKATPVSTSVFDVPSFWCCFNGVGFPLFLCNVNYNLVHI